MPIVHAWRVAQYACMLCSELLRLGGLAHVETSGTQASVLVPQRCLVRASPCVARLVADARLRPQVTLRRARLAAPAVHLLLHLHLCLHLRLRGLS